MSRARRLCLRHSRLFPFSVASPSFAFSLSFLVYSSCPVSRPRLPPVPSCPGATGHRGWRDGGTDACRWQTSGSGRMSLGRRTSTSRAAAGPHENGLNGVTVPQGVPKVRGPTRAVDVPYSRRWMPMLACTRGLLAFCFLLGTRRSAREWAGCYTTYVLSVNIRIFTRAVSMTPPIHPVCAARCTEAASSLPTAKYRTSEVTRDKVRRCSAWSCSYRACLPGLEERLLRDTAARAEGEGEGSQ